MITVPVALKEIIYGDEETAHGLVDEYCEDFESLWSWHRALSGLRKAGFQLNKALELAMIRELLDEAIRMDDYILRVVPGEPARRIKDPEGLRDYLSLSAGAMLVFAPALLNIAGLKAFAHKNGDDPDEVVDRFFEWIEDETAPPQLKMNRMEYAPHWALHLKNGERMKVPAPKVKVPV